MASKAVIAKEIRLIYIEPWRPNLYPKVKQIRLENRGNKSIKKVINKFLSR